MQAAFSISIHRVRLFRSKVAVWVVEQPHIIFDVQHVAGSVVQLFHRHFAGFDQPRQILRVILIAHTHVDAGFQCHAHRIFRVCRRAMFNQLFDCAMIGNGNAFKAPLIAQHIFQQPGVGSCWRAIQRVQRHHYRTAACIQPRFVRRHIVVKQALRTHIDGVVLFTAFYRAVSGKVFDAGHHRVAICRAFTLHRFHHSLTHNRSEIRIFPKTFGSTSPARIARDIDHRCPGHVQAIICRFISRDTPDRFHRIEVKRRGQTEANREHRALTVQHIVSKEERNFQAAQFHHLILHGADILTGYGVENRPNLPVFDHLADRLFRIIRADAD